MQIYNNNQMIKLLLEIRRRLPEQQRATLRLTNPQLLEQLIALYPQHSDEVLRSLIQQMMQLAGDHWPQQLATSLSCALPSMQLANVENAIAIDPSIVLPASNAAVEEHNPLNDDPILESPSKPISDSFNLH